MPQYSRRSRSPRRTDRRSPRRKTRRDSRSRSRSTGHSRGQYRSPLGPETLSISRDHVRRSSRSPSPRTRKHRSPVVSPRRTQRKRSERSRSWSPVNKSNKSNKSPADQGKGVHVYEDGRRKSSGVGYGGRQSPEPHGRDRDYRRQASSRATDTHGAARSFPQPDVTLHQRFKHYGNNPQEPVHVEENITVGIHRKVRGVPTTCVDHDYDPRFVVVPRRKDEGVKPIFDRPEIVGQMTDSDDEGERREIRVIRSDADERTSSRQYGRLMHGERSRYQDRDERVEDRYQGSEQGDVDMRVQRQQKEFNPVIHIRDDIGGRGFMPSDRREGFGEKRKENIQVHRRLGPEQDKPRNLPQGPHDLRYNLTNRQQPSDSREDNFDGSGGRQGRNDARGRDQYGLQQGLESRGEFSQQKTVEAPKFSERPDKYKYEEWKEKPQMIPKGINYYEHDNRDDFNYWDRRGRGRGFRGGFRGGYRGRGRDFRYSGFNREPAWKHDLYGKHDDSKEDDKPSSTTENKESGSSH